MSARDLFHQTVKNALQKQNWLITHDPYALQTDSFDLAIDLGAEKIIAAEYGTTKIAVEIKSFLGSSKISEFYGALGQFITYRLALHKLEPERNLYLAVPDSLSAKLFNTSLVQELIEENNIYLITYDIEQEIIVKWTPSPNIVSTSKSS
ncbi:MAG: fatty-acid oxidation protein subunit alpha [Cyanobacteria bacterium REEB444]|nr:fatty-acid oxidation protein subunit alpha [Cyanobacteria bacterium REEB444]